MKERKTEEVAEEVVEASKVSDELREFLEFVRQCEYQRSIFCGDIYGPDWLKDIDTILESLGIDITKPLTLMTNFPKDKKVEIFDEFIENWINAYNTLDFTKLDNYTKRIISDFAPSPITTLRIREQLKKCAQQFMEK